MSQQKNSRSAYTPNMNRPSQKRKSNRAKHAMILTLLLPPVGIAYLWRNGVFRSRGRMILTALGTLVMVLWCALLIPETQLVSEMPVPMVPAAATVAPDDGVVNALSNIDQLLAEQQAAEAALQPTEPPMTAEEIAEQAAYEAEQAQILETTVYSVMNKAKYYHAIQDCNGQTNRRMLTVREAMNEGMGACSICNPPVFTNY